MNALYLYFKYAKYAFSMRLVFIILYMQRIHLVEIGFKNEIMALFNCYYFS